MKKLILSAMLLLPLPSFAQTVVKDYNDPYGKPAKIKLREEAIQWAKDNVKGLKLLAPPRQLGLHYIFSLFMERLKTIDEKRSVYDHLYTQMKPGDVSYAPYFVHEGLKIIVAGNKDKLTDLPEYTPWRGKTVEEVFGYPGDHRLMDDIDGEATRNTCFLKESRIGGFPLGTSNTFYHEFGHFIHMTTLTEEEFWTVEKLYLAAKKRKVFLDSYAAQSVHEYFAQGIEAYVSHTKTLADRLGAYTKSDREDLKRLDLKLHDFIAGLVEQY